MSIVGRAWYFIVEVDSFEFTNWIIIFELEMNSLWDRERKDIS